MIPTSISTQKYDIVFDTPNKLVTDRTKSTTHIFHLASLFGVSNTISYFWVDMLVGIFLVGTGTIIAAALYRFGYVWTLGITLGLGVLGFLWFTLGDMGEIRSEDH